VDQVKHTRARAPSRGHLDAKRGGSGGANTADAGLSGCAAGAEAGRALAEAEAGDADLVLPGAGGVIADAATAVGVAAGLPATLRRTACALVTGLALGATGIAAGLEVAGAGVVAPAGLTGAAGPTGAGDPAAERGGPTLRADVRAGVRSAAGARVAHLSAGAARVPTSDAGADAGVPQGALLTRGAAAAIHEPAAAIGDHTARRACGLTGALETAGPLVTDLRRVAADPATLDAGAGAGPVGLAELEVPGTGADAETTTAVRGAAGLPLTVLGAGDTGPGLADLAEGTAGPIAGDEGADALPADAGQLVLTCAAVVRVPTSGVVEATLHARVEAGLGDAGGAGAVHTELTGPAAIAQAGLLDALTVSIEAEGVRVIAEPRRAGSAAAVIASAGRFVTVGNAAAAVHADLAGAVAWTDAAPAAAVRGTARRPGAIGSTAGAEVAELSRVRTWCVAADALTAIGLAAELAGTVGHTARPALPQVTARALHAADPTTLQVVADADVAVTAGAVRGARATVHGAAAAVLRRTTGGADGFTGLRHTVHTHTALAGREGGTTVLAAGDALARTHATGGAGGVRVGTSSDAYPPAGVRVAAGLSVAVGDAGDTRASHAGLPGRAAEVAAGREGTNALAIDAAPLRVAAPALHGEATPRVEGPALAPDVAAERRRAGLTGSIDTELPGGAAGVAAGLEGAGARAVDAEGERIRAGARGADAAAAVRGPARHVITGRRAALPVDADLGLTGAVALADSEAAVVVAAGLAVTVGCAAGAADADLAGVNARRVVAEPVAAVGLSTELSVAVRDAAVPALTEVALAPLGAADTPTLEVVARTGQVQTTARVDATCPAVEGPAAAIGGDPTGRAEARAGGRHAVGADAAFTGLEQSAAVPGADDALTGAVPVQEAGLVLVGAGADAEAAAAVGVAASRAGTIRGTAETARAGVPGLRAGPIAGAAAAIVIAARGVGSAVRHTARTLGADRPLLTTPVTAGGVGTFAGAADANLPVIADTTQLLEAAAGVHEAAGLPRGQAALGLTGGAGALDAELALGAADVAAGVEGAGADALIAGGALPAGPGEADPAAPVVRAAGRAVTVRRAADPVHAELSGTGAGAITDAPAEVVRAAGLPGADRRAAGSEDADLPEARAGGLGTAPTAAVGISAGLVRAVRDAAGPALALMADRGLVATEAAALGVRTFTGVVGTAGCVPGALAALQEPAAAVIHETAGRAERDAVHGNAGRADAGLAGVEGGAAVPVAEGSLARADRGGEAGCVLIGACPEAETAAAVIIAAGRAIAVRQTAEPLVADLEHVRAGPVAGTAAAIVVAAGGSRAFGGAADVVGAGLTFVAADPRTGGVDTLAGARDADRVVGTDPTGILEPAARVQEATGQPCVLTGHGDAGRTGAVDAELSRGATDLRAGLVQTDALPN
jgi:hypothetical protein